MDIFNILRQDTDDVIMIINYFLDVGEYGGEVEQPAAPAPKASKKTVDDFWNYV